MLKHIFPQTVFCLHWVFIRLTLVQAFKFQTTQLKHHDWQLICLWLAVWVGHTPQMWEWSGDNSSITSLILRPFQLPSSLEPRSWRLCLCVLFLETHSCPPRVCWRRLLQGRLGWWVPKMSEKGKKRDFESWMKFSEKRRQNKVYIISTCCFLFWTWAG